LLGINIAIIGLIFSKIKDISDKFKISFRKSLPELKKSVIEQVVIIVITIILLILKNSTILCDKLFYHSFIFDTLLNGIFFFGLYILYDTGKAIFILIESENNNN